MVHHQKFATAHKNHTYNIIESKSHRCSNTPALTPVRHEEIAICNATILAAVTPDDRCYFSPRHVCEALGIDWKSQHVKIKADPVRAKGVVEITTPSAGGAQRTAMLPIEFLSGWLFTIKKVSPEVQDKLNVFRAEGFVAGHPECF
ncbi:phage antirepressor N-terminal domain-containing protein [Nitratidesulfovibrio liaohensis]|uniref:phage antirepressor N-terminal domain-containing protein n=1 Tax=Nitratidesulfovibrio liaohensis TaxID=2604158 RepID=UPI001420B87B|nr:phage antirepressor N-terminal domain-containing protein [Nitratidesulfovibrio liaohensis]NHZ48387.1 hypothetical protein [Nitratidesulfovibrio liaohensis]